MAASLGVGARSNEAEKNPKQTMQLPASTSAAAFASTSFNNEPEAAASTQPTVGNADTKKQKMSRIAVRAHLPLLVIASCLAYLAFAISTVKTGMRGVRGIIEPRLREANALLGAAQSKYHQERFLNEHLDMLTAMPLGRRSFEDHNGCLARGITTANAYFLELPYFQYPEILNPTMEWVEDNCARLVFTPQHVGEPDSYAFLRASWARVADKSEDLLHVLKDYSSRIKEWIIVKWWGEEAAASHQVQEACEEESTKLVLQMPTGFELSCDESTRCHLAFKAPPNHLVVTEKTTQRAILEAKRKVATLTSLAAMITKTHYQFEFTLYYILHPLVVGALMVDLVAMSLTPPIPRATSIALAGLWHKIHITTRHETQAMSMLIAQLLYNLVEPFLLEFFVSPSGVDISLIVFLLMSGGAMLITFILPMASSPNIFLFVGALKHICTVLRAQIENSRVHKDTSTGHAGSDSGTAPSASSRTRSDSGTDAKASSHSAEAIDGVKISPNTTLQEDVEATRHQMAKYKDSKREDGQDKARAEAQDLGDEQEAVEQSAPMEDVELHSEGLGAGSDWTIL